MKRTLNRLLLRFSLLCVAVALGAIAVAHANRGLPNAESQEVATKATTPQATQTVQPIPATDPDTARPTPIAPAGYDASSFDSGALADVDDETDASTDPNGATDGGYYAGPEPDFGATDDASPVIQPLAQVEPAADFEAAAPETGTDAEPDFVAHDELPPLDAEQGPSLEPLNSERDVTVYPSSKVDPATSGPEEPSFAEAGPSFEQPAPALPTDSGSAEASDSAMAFTPGASQPAPTGARAARQPQPAASATAGNENQLRSGRSRGSVTSNPQPSGPTEDPLFAEPNPDAPSFDSPRLATAPSAQPYDSNLIPSGQTPPENGSASPHFGDGTLSVSDGNIVPDEILEGSQSSVTIAETEPVLEAEPTSGMQGTGKPGPTELEGPQTPSLTVHKSAPPEIQVGKPADFRVVVRNVGTVAAHEVLLRDEIPHGTELIETDPPARQTSDGAIVWEMGSIKPGDEVTAIMRVMPRMEGDIGSVATVSFQSAASARARCTKPQLVLEHGCPRQVLVGENVVFSIKLSNPGTGAATNVVLEEDVPEGLSHAAGPQLEYAVGTLKPGETRLLELRLKAAKPGMVDNLLFAKADSNLVTEHRCQLEVIAPALQVDVEGPNLRYLERPAKYTLKVANPGTAPARGVRLVAHLPKGMKFSGANNAGYYRQQDHSVVWNLAELPAKEMGTVELTAVPLEMGDLKIRLQGTAQMDLVDSDEHNTTVEGLAALLFTLVDVNDPIEVGGQTTYEIKVVNQGSKAATNLRLGAIMPPGMKPISGDGPARANVDGQRILFEPLARLAPQSELSYKIHAEGTAPGDMRIQVQLISDEFSDPIRKEESTHVYSDQ